MWRTSARCCAWKNNSWFLAFLLFFQSSFPSIYTEKENIRESFSFHKQRVITSETEDGRTLCFHAYRFVCPWARYLSVMDGVGLNLVDRLGLWHAQIYQILVKILIRIKILKKFQWYVTIDRWDQNDLQHDMWNSCEWIMTTLGGWVG